MKLFHKIAITTLGIVLAGSTGAGIAHYNRSDVKMASAATRYEYNLYSGALTEGDYLLVNSTYAMKASISSNRFANLSVTVSDNKIVTDDVTAVWHIAQSGSYWTLYNASAEKYAGGNTTKNQGALLSSVTDYAKWTVTAGSTYEFENYGRANGGSDTGNKYLRNNTTSGWACYGSSTGKAPALYKKGNAVADPTVTSVTVTAGALSGGYKGYSTIQCSATVNGENNPSQDVVWTISSNSTYVASQTSVAGASIDNKGKITFTDSATVYAFATSTVAGYTNVRGSVQCVASGLKTLVSYVQLDKTQRVKVGMKVAILNNAGDYSLSKTQNTNNRAAIAAESDEVGGFKISKIQEDNVQLFDLVAGTQPNSFAFSYDDSGTTRYIYAAGTGTSNQLKTTTVLADDSSFTITISAGVAEIVSCDSSRNGHLRYNYNSGNPIFACYSSDCNASLYIAGTSLPDDIPLTSISDVAIENFEVYSTVNLTANYLPVTATEGIVVTATNTDGEVEIGTPVMADGVLTVSVKGLVAGNVTITLTGEYTTTAVANKAFVVSPYSATHNKITSSSSIYNGVKVILGNSEHKLASGLHTGGNNVPAVEIGFSDDGNSLSNAGGSAVEYTLWQFTIDELTGWAFYDNGYFLTAGTGNNNYLKRNASLSKYCLFNITFDAGQVNIVSVCTDVTRNTMFANKSSKIFSCYAADTTTQELFDLYSNNASQTNANVIAGFEDALLKMDAISESDKGTGLCKSNHYYEYAKNVYNNVLTEAQKALMSSEGNARLAAWAAANGEHIDNYQLLSNTHLTIRMNNNNVWLIVVMSSIAAISLAGVFFIIRKRKHQ